MTAAASAAGPPQHLARTHASERCAAGRRWHGLGWGLVRRSDGRRAERLSALVDPGFELDPLGVDEAWGQRESTGRRTIAKGVQRQPLALDDRERERPDDAIAAFEDAVESFARACPHAVLALGGGLDAAAVLVAWRERTGSWPWVVTVRTGHATYDEVDAARSLCTALGVPLEVIDVPDAAREALLRPAVRAVQSPLYGWHPVVRLGLAHALRERGHAALVTGDGADALARGRPDHDYVPLVAALTEAAGLSIGSPYWDDRVVSARLAAGPEPDKRWLRRYLADRGAPAWLTESTKVPRRLDAPAPASSLDIVAEALPPLAARLGRPLSLGTDRERLRWLTLHELVTSIEEGAR